jgi:hypothetical protein
MAVIDWNHIVLDVSPLVGARLFLELLMKCGKVQSEYAFAALPDDWRKEIITSIIDGTADPEVVRAGEIGEAISILVAELSTGHARLIRSRVENGAPFGRSGEPYVFRWIGNRTGQRHVELLLFPQSGKSNICFSTGTGKPSRFLEPFCTLTIAQVGKGISEAMG